MNRIKTSQQPPITCSARHGTLTPLGDTRDYYTKFWTDGNALPDTTHKDFAGFTTIDDPCWSLPYMQDCMRQVVNLTPAQAYIDNPANGFGDIILGISSGIDQYYSMHINRLLHNMVSISTGRNWDPLRGLTLSGLYGTLRDPKSTSVTIDQNPFDSEFSIWYLIVDLIEIPKLARSLWKVKDLLVKFRGFRGSLKELSDHYLSYQFGLRPTLDDLRQFAELFLKWGTKYTQNNEAFSKLYTVRDKISISDAVDYRPEFYRYREFGSLTDINVRVEYSRAPVQLYQTTKYYFVCPELSSILNRMKQLVDILGILDPAAIWDVIPFSFLVDWFIPVGSWVHSNLKPQLLPADVVVCDWCESINRDVEFRVYASYPRWKIDQQTLVYRPDDVGDSLVAAGRIQQYSRKRQFPAPLKVVTSKLDLSKSIVTIRRAFLGSALVVQGVCKPRRGKSSKYRKHH